MKEYFTKNAKNLIILAILLVLTVLLCIPATISTFVGVFGYVVYLYLIIGYVALILSWKKINLKLDKKNIIVVAIAYIFVVATIHTALLGREVVNGGFGVYVAGAYENKTVGGVIFSLITSPIALTLKYVASIIIFFAGAAVSSFFVLKSFIFVEKKPVKKSVKSKEETKKVALEIVKTEPIIQEVVESGAKATLPQEKVKEERPTTAKELLFGNMDNDILKDIDIKSKSYGTQKYTFDAPKQKKVDLTEGLEKYLPLDKKKQEERQSASSRLFGSYEEKPVEQTIEAPQTKQQTIGAEIGETMGYNTYIPTETIFSNEPPQKEELPTVGNSTFVQALRQEKGQEPQKVVEEAIEQEDFEEVDSVEIKKPQEAKEQSKDFTKKKAIASYDKPPISLLRDHASPGFSPYVENYEELKEVFEEKLKNYNIDVTLVKAIKGPTITTCVLDLSERCPISKVYSAKMDIQRLLHSQKEINIIPQVGDSAYFGIEIPNKVTAMVSFKEIISSPDYINAKGDIVLALGKTAAGKILVDDLAAMPHALIAGATGSGKSVCINVILASILYRYSPEEVKLVLIDLKTVEMGPYANLPHMLFNNPLSDVQEITNVFQWAREETMRRFAAFKRKNCRNLKEYNGEMDKEDKLPRIVIIIDEASELMTDPKSGKAMDASLCSLARMSRAAGIHLIFATQNPIKEVITNEIQNNLNTKIAFKVGDYNHSMVIFKAKGAETLLGNGDMYIKKGTEMQRAQCAYIHIDEIEDMVDYIKKKNPVEFDYFAIDRILHGDKEEVVIEEIKSPTTASGVFIKKDLDNDESFQMLLREGLRICLERDKVSTSLLQREMSKGFNSIAKLVEYMEDKGFISAPYSGNKRTINITKAQFNEMYPEAPIE